MEREGEISAIDDLLAAVSGGTGGLLLVEGAAGLGKSRLLAHASAVGQALHLEVLSARARQEEGDCPLAVVLQAFEPCLARLESAGRDAVFAGAAGLAASLFSEPFDEGGYGQRSPFSLMHGLYWLTANLATRRPLLICVDDVQWSDEASARFLVYLAERLEGLPIGLLLGGRPFESDADRALSALSGNPAVKRRVLRPLRSEGVREVVRCSFPAAEDDFCSVCMTVTGGNPFRVCEVLVEVGAQRMPPVAASAEGLRTLGAATISRAALFRLVRLGSAARAVADAVAILGDDAPLRRVAALARLELAVVARAADALAVEGILLPGEPLGFVHPLIRALIIDEAPPVRQALSHRLAAKLLSDEDAPPEQIATQLLRASGAGEEWAVVALRAAGRRAWARGAPDSAANYLRRALAEPPEQDQRAGVLAELGEAEAAAGMSDAPEHLRQALDQMTDPTRRARITRVLARALADQGLAAEAATVLEAAIEAVGAQDHVLACSLLGDYLACTAFEPARRQQAFLLVDPLLGALPPGLTGHHLPMLAAVTLRSAQEPRSNAITVELAERAWDGGRILADDGPDGSAWLMIVWALILAEDYGTAERLTSAVLDAARTVGSVTAFSTASYYHGYACLRRGNLIEAQADAEQTMGVAGAGARRYADVAALLRAVALIERGEIDLAEETILASRCAELTWMLDRPWRLHARGRVALARQRPAEALELFQQAGAWLEERLTVHHTVLPWRIDAAHAALAIGDRSTAKELVGPLQSLTERSGASITQAKIWGVLGLIEEGPAGIGLLRRSAEMLETSQGRLEHAYALTDLGAAMRRSGQRSESRIPLRRALGLAQDLDANLLAGRVTEELAAAGAHPRRTAVSGAAALTPSEQRVGCLAARQMTNSEIAQMLFVSPKTVEFHLRHVYQKLGIIGRSGLEGALSRTVALPLQRAHFLHHEAVPVGVAEGER